MHECPDCFAGCYCRGDIDDTLLAALGGCLHCDDGYIVYGPDEFAPDPQDCLGCGTCDGCVSAAIAYAEEMARNSS